LVTSWEWSVIPRWGMRRAAAHPDDKSRVSKRSRCRRSDAEVE
jgi:hypothetical protein